jgi:archaellin
MKKIIFFFTLIFLINCTTSFELNITEESSDNILIAGSQEKLIFNLTITNLGAGDYIKFYNLQGFQMFPIGTTPLNSKETKEIQLEIYPIGDIKERGEYIFNYFIENSKRLKIKENLTLRIIELDDVLTIGSEKIDLNKNTIIFYIQNEELKYLKDINAKFKSKFFEVEKTFSLNPKEKKEFEIELESGDVSRLAAGFYPLKAEINYKEAKENLEGVMKFLERNDLEIKEESSGTIINTQIIKKTNKGNVDTKTVTSIQRSFFSSIFTTFSQDPDIIEKEGFERYYIWEKNLTPGETIEIKIKTNYLFPLLILFLTVFIIFFLKIYLTSDLILKKKINFVHSKTGELVLKVSILINARRYVENVNVLDRLPALVKLHPKFGGEIPTRADEKKRRIEWNFTKFEAGERKRVSYIIYSKIGVLGKFALPFATAVYERQGKIKEAKSNKSYFVAEKRKKDEEEK